MRFENPSKNVFIISTGIAILFYSCSLKPTPRKVFEDQIKAKNSHNITAAMSYLADDAVLEIPKMGIKLKGKESRMAIAEYDTALHTILTPSNIEVNGDTIFCAMTEHNDWVAAAGIQDLYFPITIHVIKDGRISYDFADMADSSKENIERVLDHFVFWGNEKYPEKMRTMAPNGDFVYNAANGVMVVDMLREWKAEQDSIQQQSVSGTMPKRLGKDQ